MVLLRYEDIHDRRPAGQASELRKAISREPQALLTASGEPIALLVPVIEPLTESAAVNVCVPAVRSVPENVPVPLVSVLLAGRVELPSVLLKWTVPL